MKEQAAIESGCERLSMLTMEPVLNRKTIAIQKNGPDHDW